ncbi:hypothetical protein EB093_02880 [bacterium]|nr:hypothetical protein [bacterium]
MANKPKRQITQAQARQMAPSVRKFNSIAKVLIRLLSEKVEAKEKALGKISVIVNTGYKSERRSQISITTVDINKTMISQKGKLSYTQSMSWEEQLKRQRRGKII